jgi:hypothetical protein
MTFGPDFGSKPEKAWMFFVLKQTLMRKGWRFSKRERTEATEAATSVLKMRFNFLDIANKFATQTKFKQND